MKSQLIKYFYAVFEYKRLGICISVLMLPFVFMSCGSGRNENTSKNGVQIKQAKDIQLGYLEIDDDIEIQPAICSFEEIELLYLNYQEGKNVQNLDSLKPHLQMYFEGMEEGNNPFDLFIEEPKYKFKVDTSILRHFLEELRLLVKID